MFGKFITGVILASLVFFVWGFLFWGLLDIGSAVYDPVPNSATVIESLKGTGMVSGTYMYPVIEHTGLTWSDDGAQEKLQELHRNGPVFEVRYHADGVGMMGAATMAVGFLHFLVSTLLAAMLMRMAFPGLHSYGRRVVFLTTLGLFAGVFANLSGPIWFYYPWDRALLDTGYDVIGWFLAGLVLAKFVKPSIVAGDGSVLTSRREPVVA